MALKFLLQDFACADVGRNAAKADYLMMRIVEGFLTVKNTRSSLFAANKIALFSLHDLAVHQHQFIVFADAIHSG